MVREVVTTMINTQEQLKALLNELGLYVFIEEHENGDYLGVCNSIDTDADIYIYDNGEVTYMDNETSDHNILKVKGIGVLTQAVSLINSYQLSKLF